MMGVNKVRVKQLMILTCLCVIITGLVACGQRDQVRPMMVGHDAVADQTNADQAKQVIASMEEVVDVKGVSLEDKIYVAPQVRHRSRFNLEGIRKEGFERIKKRHPDATVYFSTDKKIYMELEKLEQQLQKRTISKGRLKKRLGELEELMKG